MDNHTPKTITIQLTKGQFTVIDSIDADLTEFNWSAHANKKVPGAYYAMRNTRIDGKLIDIFMHRIILARILGRELKCDEYVDHADLNPLNNTRSNLRLVNASQNCFNRRRKSNNTSGYKGVSFKKEAGKWIAYINVGGKRKYLGYFDTPESAHEAYKTAATELHGEFARFE